MAPMDAAEPRLRSPIPCIWRIADDTAMRAIIANGVRGTSMPAFAQHAGGMLTDKQIDVITQRDPSALEPAGNSRRCESTFLRRDIRGRRATRRGRLRAYCESCHGAGGRGGPKGSAITNDSFLALVSDQGLRTIVITGRPELGAPDWRGNVSGKPMSDQEVTDVVAWLASRRVRSPGQPYSASN